MPTPELNLQQDSQAGLFKRRLDGIYSRYAVGLVFFALSLAALERAGMSRNWIGLCFLFATVALYAGIGIASRTSNATEYYVAGRRVPAMYNGMATAADWMSAASFIGMAGTLYLQGYNGLAFVMGWTGGYCLVALLLAPYLRRFGQFTIPDFLGDRYASHAVRLTAVAAAIVCSFTYIVAQVYGMGLITARLTGIAFEIGIFVGLGGILMCSFLGGMRAITWTQVAQYIILVMAYLVPVVWLSVKQTGFPVPQLIYGLQLEKVTAKEAVFLADPKEHQVIDAYAARARALELKLRDVPAALAADRAKALSQVAALKKANASEAEIAQARRELAALPKTAEATPRLLRTLRTVAPASLPVDF